MWFIGYTYIPLPKLGQRAKLAEHLRGDTIRLHLDYEPRGYAFSSEDWLEYTSDARVYKEMPLNEWRRVEARHEMISNMVREIEEKYCS